MKLSLGALTLLAVVSIWATPAYAVDCSGLPTSFNGNEFPTGNFFSNFDGKLAPCYLINLTPSNGAVITEGDLNAVYYTVFFKVDPRYQLVVLGNFPNARYMNIAPYDSHFAPIPYISDTDIVPLAPTYSNPFQPGNSYVAGQKYAVPINLGGTPGTVETGCSTSAFAVDVNALDGTQRHQSMNWNSDAAYSQQNPQVPPHIVDTPQHSNPNTAIMLHVRIYLNIGSQVPQQDVPHVILRDVASGCAYPAAYALQTLQVVSTNRQTATSMWMDSVQEANHVAYENYLPQLCYAVDPQNEVAWERGAEYVEGTGLTDSYLSGTLPNGIPQTLAAAGEVLRIRMRIPTTPPTPCTDGCSRSGNEQTRYTSLSFVDYTSQSCGCNTTIASMADRSFTQDSKGYATLIVGTGAHIPSWITPAHGYTFLDLTAIPTYQQFNNLVLRNILPNSNFGCSGFVIPYLAEGYTPTGNLTSDYMPVVDYPVAVTLPTVATPLVRSPSCGAFPVGRPAGLTACTVLAPLATGITAVTTQCAAPGCSGVVAQAQPPITISGHGLGLFPQGLPYTGNSNYLQITDTTQGWQAGYETDKCNVTIYQWNSDLIELVANVNQNGVCPLAAGDKLTVKVWDPQNPGSPPASIATTVSAN
jgi:hypothetical protein